MGVESLNFPNRYTVCQTKWSRDWQV